MVFKQDTMVLDSNSIVAETFSITNGSDTLRNYILKPYQSTLIWKDKRPVDTVIVSYLTFPLNFAKEYSRKNIDSVYWSPTIEKNPFVYEVGGSNSGIDNLDIYGLSKSGSISRSFLVGNNRDLAVNSNFNLQLNGKLSENLNVLASVSDENIPIQPQGNTALLQDFDRVFIQIYNEQFKIIAGDFDLNNTQNHFLKYQKRVKGGGASVKVPSEVLTGKEGGELQVDFNGAISKGKFARTEIQGVEGNQGPYPLPGNNDEKYIMVLSGTERVYIDGRLLKRGQINDYIIDYNTAELTFTANQLITKDRRIIVEYQYVDQNYVRTLVQTGVNYSEDKFNVGFNFYSENDNKNQPLQQELTNDDKRLLASIGDSLDQAFVPGYDSSLYADDLVLYKVVDTMGFDSVFVYTTEPDSSLYTLTFTDIGQGGGNYIQTGFDANGTIYQWVAPVWNGTAWVPQGRYEPIRVLVAPNKNQMFVVNGTFEVGKNAEINFEGALSNNDINTFSKSGNSDNQGLALNLGYKQKVNLGKSKTQKWTGVIDLRTETVNQNFKPIERYRRVEFERDWNVLNQTLSETQYLNSIGFKIQNQSLGSLAYFFESYNVANQYDGYKHNFVSQLNNTKYRANITASYLNSTSENSTVFLRHKADIALKTKALVVGFRDEHELNKYQTNGNDSLLNSSYQFYDWKVYVQNGEHDKNKFEAYYGQRIDQKPKENELTNANWAQETGASLQVLSSKIHKLKTSALYRELKVQDSSISNNEAENTTLGRIDYQLRLLKSALSFTTFYEIGSGLERKREYVFREVPAGQGNFIWVDYNDDGVKDLNEFEEDPYSGFANYIRVFVLTNDYQRVYTNEFRENINIDFRKIWRNKTGFLKFMSRFSNRFVYQVKRQTNFENEASRFNPFVIDIADTNLVSTLVNFRNNLAFNRANPKFGMDYTFNNQARKTLFTSGIDQYEIKFHEIKLRWNFIQNFSLNTSFEIGDKSNVADYLSGKNFIISYYQVSPKLIYQPSTSMRFSLFSDISFKQNDIDLGGEEAKIYTGGVEFKYNQLKKGSLQGNVALVYNDYKGENNSSITFEMLESLQPGKNYTWEVIYQRNLGKNLQLSFNYYGRYGDSKQFNHAGGMQIRAFF